LSRNELPADGNWTAVHKAVHDQMKRLGMSIARLSRESGISETTIRHIGQPEKRQRSTLVAISAALGYPYDHLVDVLRDEADPEAPPQSPAETALIKELLRAEVDPLKVKVDVIDGKVDRLLDRQRKG
jgi:lambda repressor-like predicted transcriptional regulator